MFLLSEREKMFGFGCFIPDSVFPQNESLLFIWVQGCVNSKYEFTK